SARGPCDLTHGPCEIRPPQNERARREGGLADERGSRPGYHSLAAHPRPETHLSALPAGVRSQEMVVPELLLVWRVELSNGGPVVVTCTCALFARAGVACQLTFGSSGLSDGTRPPDAAKSKSWWSA